MKILPFISIFSLFFAGSFNKNTFPVMHADLTKKITYLALGDSYTIGESVSESERYPVILSGALNEDHYTVSPPEIIATTGWTTADLKNGISHAGISGKKYDMVSLLIGVNNEYQGRSVNEYKMEFKELLLTAIDFAKGNKKKVFVISIPDYGFTPSYRSNQTKISAAIDKFNAANKHITDSLGIKYFDITPISRKGLADPELVASDGLHPSGKMYRQWVEMIRKDIFQMLANP
jgi:lysophospholipase L1-like esterase